MKTRKNCICYLAAAAVILALFSPARSYADDSAAAPCVLGYTVGFFNGVWNTEAEAMVSLNALRQSVEEATGKSDDTYNNEDVGYQLLYNHTGSTADGTFMQDIAEVFEQRQKQLDPSGTFSSNFYMFWENITGNNVFSQTVSLASPEIGFFFSNFAIEYSKDAAAAISALVSNPPTAQDYAAQNAELDTLASAGRRMVLIAHSQGNLFITLGYDHIEPVVGPTRVTALHIAPASPTLRGAYILSLFDSVINALRLDGGPSSVPPVNIAIAVSPTDLTGHTLVGTYLDDDPLRNNGRQQVEALEMGAFSALTAPSTCTVKVSPSSSTLQPDKSVTLTAAVNPQPTDSFLNIEYVWSISGNTGGTFSTPTGPVTSLNTSSNTVTYYDGPAFQSQTLDTITVKVLAAKTAGDYVNVVDLGTGTATVTVSSEYVEITPTSANVTQGGQAAFAATVHGVSNTTGYSYLWTTSGKYGTLTEPGGTGRTGQTSYCSTFAEATYVSNPNATLPSNSTASDTITVQALVPPNGTDPCSPSNAVAPAVTATVYVNASSLAPWLGAWNCPSAQPGNLPYTLTLTDPTFGGGGNVLYEYDTVYNTADYEYTLDVTGNTARDARGALYPTFYYALTLSGGAIDVSYDDGVTTYVVCTR